MSFLFICANTFFIYIGHLIYKYIYADEIPLYIYDFLWYLIYYYSRLQIYVNKIINYIKSHACFDNLINKYVKISSNKQFEYIKDGDVIFITESNKKNDDLDYDFIILLDNDGTCNNNIILNDISDNILNYEKSDLKFIMVEITINNIIIPINFRTDEYNYLIVNNNINQQFIKYFLKKYYYTFLDANNPNIDLYSVKLIDQNADYIQFDFLKSLIINKDNYILK
jgi:hypothetical protein